MNVAPDKATVEAIIRNSRKANSLLLVFAPYNDDKLTDTGSFVGNVNEFHYHSGGLTQMFCSGYAQYGEQSTEEAGRGTSLEHLDMFPLTYYYPNLFNKLRREISSSLENNWNYTTGVDLLLFGTEILDDQTVVNWKSAAVVSSKDTVGSLFSNVEEMVRTVLNLNEGAGGNLKPEQLSPEMNRRHLKHRVSKLANRFGGDILTGGVSFIIG